MTVSDTNDEQLAKLYRVGAKFIDMVGAEGLTAMESFIVIQSIYKAHPLRLLMEAAEKP